MRLPTMLFSYFSLRLFYWLLLAQGRPQLFFFFQIRIVIVNRCGIFSLCNVRLQSQKILIVQLVSDCQALLWLDSDPWHFSITCLGLVRYCLKELHHSEPNYDSTTWFTIQFRYPQPCIAYLYLILYRSLTLHSLIDLSRSFGSIKGKSYNNIVCQRYLTIYKDIPYLYYYNCTWSNLSISDLQLFAFRRLSTLRQICFYSEYCFSILKLHYLHRLCSCSSL